MQLQRGNSSSPKRLEKLREFKGILYGQQRENPRFMRVYLIIYYLFVNGERKHGHE